MTSTDGPTEILRTPRASSSGLQLFRLPMGVKLPAGILLLAVAVAYAFYGVFTRKLSVDEGYLMITVRGFLEGNPLYDTLFTQYGPFYYLYEWILRAVLHVPLTHDATRWMCEFHWIASAVILAVTAGRMTRSFVVGALVFTQAVIHLGGLANEPGHPQELVVLLLTMGVAFATKAGGRIGSWEILAVITAALALTKINVGAFFGFALLLAIRCHANDRFGRWSNWLLLALCCAAPFLLMRHRLAIEWCRSHSIVIACALMTTFVTAWRFSHKEEIPFCRYLRITAFFVAPAMAFAAVAVVTGSSVHGLIDGLIVTPLKMPEVVYVALPLRTVAPIMGMVAAVTALLVAWRGTDGHAGAAVTLLKLWYGFLGAFGLIGEPIVQFAYLLPWSWLALVPTGNQESRTATQMFPRVFLCLAAVWQSLQTYPVAGTQVTNGTCLLMVTYMLCLTDVLRGLSLPQRIKESITRIKPNSITLGQGFGAALLLYIFANVWCELPVMRRGYASLSPVELPGARMIRMPAETKEFYHKLVAYLDANTDTFITIPSENSLYFWTTKRPPTQLNGAGWYQFNHDQQEKILAAVRRSSRGRIIVPDDLMRNLTGYWYTPEQIAPLIKCLSNEYEEVTRIGTLVVFAPKPASNALQATDSTALARPDGI